MLIWSDHTYRSDSASSGVGTYQGSIGELLNAFREQSGLLGHKAICGCCSRQNFTHPGSSSLYGETSLNTLNLHFRAFVSDLVYPKIKVRPSLCWWQEMRRYFDISVSPRPPFALQCWQNLHCFCLVSNRRCTKSVLTDLPRDAPCVAAIFAES
jgi:hypothetical protein